MQVTLGAPGRTQESLASSGCVIMPGMFRVHGAGVEQAPTLFPALWLAHWQSWQVTYLSGLLLSSLYKGRPMDHRMHLICACGFRQATWCTGVAPSAVASATEAIVPCHHGQVPSARQEIGVAWWAGPPEPGPPVMEGAELRTLGVVSVHGQMRSAMSHPPVLCMLDRGRLSTGPRHGSYLLLSVVSSPLWSAFPSAGQGFSEDPWCLWRGRKGLWWLPPQALVSPCTVPDPALKVCRANGSHLLKAAWLHGRDLKWDMALLSFQL
jgi:hypothetical protein